MGASPARKREKRAERSEKREERREKREERREERERERVLDLSWLRVRKPSPFLSPKSPYQPQAGLIGIYIYIFVITDCSSMCEGTIAI